MGGASSHLKRTSIRRDGFDVRGEGPYSAKNAAALMPFRAALANRENAACSIFVLGNSVEEGYTSTGSTFADRQKAWPAVLGKVLRARFPTAGESVLPALNYAGPYSTAATFPTGFTLSANWSTGNWGLSGRAASTSTAGSTLTYTTPIGTTSIDVCSLVSGAGATGYTVTVDGGAPSATQGTTATAGTSRDGAAYRVTLDPTTTHTIVITSVGNSTTIDGILLYQGNESKGIRVFNASLFGSDTLKYLSTGTFGWLRAGSITNAATIAGVQGVATVSPDLIITGLQENDYKAWRASTWASQLSTIVAAMRLQVPTKTVPVVYLSKWRPHATLRQSATSDSWDTYRAATRALAAADPFGVYLDLADVMPAPGSALANTLAMYNDDVHARANGYGVTADAIASFIAS